MSHPTATDATGRAERRGPSPVVLVVAAAVFLAAAVAVVIALTSGGDDDDGPNSSSRPEDLADAGGEPGSGEAVSFDTAVGAVTGDPLPTFSDPEDDPAVGMPAPRVVGTDLEGNELTVPQTGRPAMLLFMAHWCPHCQAELEGTTAWLEDGGLPEAVDLVAVATYVDPGREQYPPSEWLQGQGWPAPAVADADTAIGEAYGLEAVPYWVIVDAEGNVVERRSGVQTQDQIEEMLAAAQGD